MGLFSALGKGLSSIFKGGSNLLSSIGSSILGPSSVAGNVNFLNTPATLSNAINSAVSSGNWVGDAIGGIINNAGSTLLSPATIGGGSYSSYMPSLTPVAEPKTLNDAWGLSGPSSVSGQVPLTNTGGVDLGGLLNVAGQLLTPAAPPQTVDQGVMPPSSVSGQVPLVNTPTSILPPGNTITPPATTNPFQDILKTLVQGGALSTLLSGQKNELPAEADALRQLAGDLRNRGTSMLEAAMAQQQGFLPGNALNGIERRLRQSEAAMRKSYADMGMSGSTMEQQDLAALRERANEETFTIGSQMAQSGLATAAQLIGDTSNIYTNLLQAEIEKDQEFTKALMALAAAAAK